MEHQHDKLWDMIKDIRFAMFVTRHSNGHLHGRPMTTQNKKEDDGSSLWFFMSKSNDAVEDIATEPSVGVMYGDPGSDTWVSVSGHAAVVDDLAKKKALWSKMTEAWFPNGPQDADLALVQVKIVHANYWDVKENKLVQLLKMTTAAVTGKPPTDMGEHGEVRMN